MSILRKTLQKMYTRIVTLVAQCHPSMEGLPRLLLRTIAGMRNKVLPYTEVYISWDERRLNKAAWLRMSVRVSANCRNFVPGASFSPRLSTQILRRNGGSAKESAKESSNEGAAERHTVNRASLRYMECSHCSRRCARPARTSISSTWVVTIVCNTRYCDLEGKYQEIPWSIDKKKQVQYSRRR